MNKDVDWIPFCALMKATAETCATEPKSKNALGLTFAVLSKYSLEQVKAAVMRHFATKDGKFYPTPSHIINLIEGDSEDRAELAWRLFLRAIQVNGYYNSVTFENPAIRYAIFHLGGWIKINEELNKLSEKELSFWGKDFKRLYTVGEREANDKNVPSYFQGAIEADNKFHGYDDFMPEIYLEDTHNTVTKTALSEGQRGHINSTDKAQNLVLALSNNLTQKELDYEEKAENNVQQRTKRP